MQVHIVDQTRETRVARAQCDPHFTPASHMDQREGGKHCRHRHHGVSRSAKARQWVGAKLEHPRASWGLSSITWRYKRRRRPQGHSEDGHGPEMDRREDPNVNYLPAFATQRQREGAHQPGQAGQSHSSPSLLISPATTSGANTGDADVGTRCNLCECSHPDRQCTSSQETPPQMHADACYPHRRGSRSPSEVHEHTEDGPT